MENPQKTNKGRFISGYECGTRITDNEFLLAKRQYLNMTGRVRGSDDVVAYHVRQAFRRGEVTQSGTIACECEHRHLHINDDWVIVIDVQSDKILLTNLYNYTQIFSCYEVTDRVVLHREGCLCGDPSPWLELERRNDDVVSFAGKVGVVKIPLLVIYAVSKEVHLLKRFQLLVYPDNKVAL